ncbi:Ger(x)C family spore germination protein [Paenibacillus sp. LMG 31460]|uniref:Ger(X)C family spore germination protein n=1 Tax=Paenibacillus germinis TaxID=2654979 RepID=A0ABX1Z3G7_9BACL|nr:Ger(x)C family spore germination protein [Paenibacillus germinis]NOU86435.1 Ger(x)C family spore germination protein [Paenibacillus germinis]
MRVRILLVLILLMMPVLSGCWSRIEVNDLAFVTAAGIDKMEDGKIRLALQVAIPRMLGAAGQGGFGGEKGIGTKAVWVVSEKGETILDAYRRLQEKLPRRIFFSHSGIIIIGEQLARDGVSPILDFFIRQREARMRSYILFTKGEAVKILKFVPKLEKVPSEIMREEVKQHIGLRINLKDFAHMLVTDGVEPVAAEMELVSSNLTNAEDSKGLSPSNLETNLSLKGSAIFKKDKLIGWMNDMETRGILWLRKEMKMGVVTVNIPKENGKISVLILNAETQITPIFKDGELSMEVKVRAENELYENNSKLDVGDPKVIHLVENALEADLIQRIQLVLDMAQNKFKSDIFGFGIAVERRYPKEWKNKFKEQWEEEFPNLKVNIKADVTVNRTGLTNKPLILKEKETEK